jgi:penicillin amidase
VISELLAWDGASSAESRAAALFQTFYHRLITNLLEPELGSDIVVAYTEIFNQCLAPLNQILSDPSSPWFHRVSRKALVEKSLLDALSELQARLRSPMEQWQWGQLHSLLLRHPLGGSRFLGPIFSRGPFPSPGDSATVNSGFFNHAHPYQHGVGASLRTILDLGHWESSTFIVAGGQSGDPFSPHYDDQLEHWREGAAIQLYYGEEKMGSWPVMVL